MFVKTNNNNRWINLGTCRSVETHQLAPSQPWQIVLCSAVILSDTVKQFVGQFETEAEAEEAINAMWQAYRDGEKVWEVESFNSISPDEHWTSERFNELISQAEYREFYESQNQTEKLCELGTDLMALIQREQWELNYKFNKFYFALYFRGRRVFGINLFARPKLAVWLPEDVLAERNDDLFDDQYVCESYHDSHKWGIYPEHVTVANIEDLLEFAYFWHAGLLV